MKTLFEQKIDEWNRTRGPKDPSFSFSFVGETSKEAELDVQTKFVMCLLDLDLNKMFN